MKSGLVIMPLVATVLAGLCMPAAAQQNPPLSADSEHNVLLVWQRRRRGPDA